MPDIFHETTDEVREATNVTIGVCTCPDVHILLLDEHGRIFARGVLSPEDFATTAKNVAAHVAVARAARGDTIGDVVGRA